MLVGLTLRVYHIGAASIWLDEGLSVFLAKMSLPQLAQALPATELSPPLYDVVLHYWVIPFGDSEVAVRFVSALFGVLAIPMMYLISEELFDEEAGLLGAFILAISTLNVQYSQEARMYSLMVLLALLSMYFFVKLVRKNDLAISAAYILFTTLLLYTHVYGLIVVLAQNLCVVALSQLSPANTFRLRRWIALEAIVVALFVPWVGILVGQVSAVQRGFWVPLPTLGTVADTFVAYAGTVSLLVLFVGLSVLSVFTYTKVSGHFELKAPLKALGNYSWTVRVANVASVLFLLAWLLTLNVVPFVISQFFTPVYFLRYTLAASVALYALVAGGIRNINSRYVKLAVVAVIVILSAANLQQYYAQDTNGDAREAFGVLNENLKSGDIVILFPAGAQYVFDYYNRATAVDAKPFPSAQGYYSEGQANAKSTADNIKELLSDVDGHDRVWFVSATGHGSAALLIQAKNALNESYFARSAQSYQGYEVLLYEKRA